MHGVLLPDLSKDDVDINAESCACTHRHADKCTDRDVTSHPSTTALTPTHIAPAVLQPDTAQMYTMVQVLHFGK